MKTLATLVLIFTFTSPVSSVENHHSPYIGEQHRTIKSLSERDIDELQQGSGWGLAKAAELNGIPGPAHVMEMADALQLTEKQKQAIQHIYHQMKTKAIALGKKLIMLESQLNQAFTNQTINAEKLTKYVQQIETVRAHLRITHLSAHLDTPNILNTAQTALYNQLRGYTADRCQHTPNEHHTKIGHQQHRCR